jgi:hypothetical protein
VTFIAAAAAVAAASAERRHTPDPRSTFGQLEVVGALLEAGAGITATNNVRSPAQKCQQHGRVYAVMFGKWKQ